MRPIVLVLVLVLLLVLLCIPLQWRGNEKMTERGACSRRKVST